MNVETAQRTGEDEIRDLIYRLLQDFPKITRSMIAAHVSPVAAEYGVDYKKVLEQLVASGTVIQKEKIRENRKRVPTFELAA